MEIRVQRLADKAELPVYQTAGAAAADVAACLDEPVSLQPGERRIIPTGLSFEIPTGYEIQVRARSGLAAKHGLSLVNGIGTIDADYRGELGVILINLGQEAFVVEHGMRIAQLVVAPAPQATWHEVAELGETERGKGGYGSTGH